MNIGSWVLNANSELLLQKLFLHLLITSNICFLVYTPVNRHCDGKLILSLLIVMSFLTSTCSMLPFKNCLLTSSRLGTYFNNIFN